MMTTEMERSSTTEEEGEGIATGTATETMTPTTTTKSRWTIPTRTRGKFAVPSCLMAPKDKLPVV